jgi:hypothetical protein
MVLSSLTLIALRSRKSVITLRAASVGATRHGSLPGETSVRLASGFNSTVRAGIDFLQAGDPMLRL